MPQNSAAFFENRDCAYFPCHPWPVGESFNCLFCYCPLYAQDCGGAGKNLPDGNKDCSACIFPHRAENYEAIIARLGGGE